MLSSSARLNAGYPLGVANAGYPLGVSTGPRTAEGKAASSRNALSHGAYATDDTLLAACVTQLSGSASRVPSGCLAFVEEQTHSVPSSEHQPAQLDPTVENDGPALLASFTSYYNPSGPAEMLLVRRYSPHRFT